MNGNKLQVADVSDLERFTFRDDCGASNGQVTGFVKYRGRVLSDSGAYGYIASLDVAPTTFVELVPLKPTGLSSRWHMRRRAVEEAILQVLAAYFDDYHSFESLKTDVAVTLPALGGRQAFTRAVDRLVAAGLIARIMPGILCYVAYETYVITGQGLCTAAQLKLIPSAALPAR